MHGDFSRLTFDPAKHYAGVLLQQGRVQTDADWNEATLIQRHHLETTAADVIGPTGAPRDHAGFQIAAVAGGLSVSAGRYYVDGILCENEAPRVVAAAAGAPAGLYAVYLDVWRRHVSAAEDPDIRETALGGPDTATRLQVAWQVRAVRVGNASAGATCTSVRPLWQAALPRSTGTLRAATRTPATPATPCEIPATAGYRGLENQLYRVEVHQAGDETSARFKWSRENGSVVASVEGVSGVEVTLRELRTDDPLGFAPGDWVELLDDRAELQRSRGELLRIAQLFPERRVVQLTGAPADPVDPARHPRLRRWDQTAGADAQGLSVVPAAGATAIALERGLEVTFGAGRYEVGDHWVIPARTALGGEGGTILWPTGAFRPPAGVVHHHALLAAFDFDGTAFTPTAAPDCRELFPPLTDLHATDVAYDAGPCADLASATTVQQALDLLCERQEDCCGTTVEPVPGWERVFDDIPARGHAHLCFRAADYPLAATKEVIGKGTIRISGAGPASRIVADRSECALRFVGCVAVTVTDLAVVSGTPGRTTPDSDHLDGVLTFDNVGTVAVERVAASCRPFQRRRSSCLTVRAAEAANAPASEAARVFGPANVRIRGCDLEVGYLQVGILLVNVARATVEDNVVRAGREVPRAAQIRRRVTDVGVRARIGKLLVAEASTRAAAPTPEPQVSVGAAGAVTMRAGAHEVRFVTDPQVAAAWPALIAAAPPPDVTTAAAVSRHVALVADRLLHDAAFRDRFSLLGRWFDLLRQDNLPVAAQGIVVGGRVARELRIRGNTVTDVVDGIHVGVSHREPSRGAPDRAGTLLVADNTVEVVLPAATTRQRYGVYVGNCESAVIENNSLSVRRTSVTQRMHVDGIHVHGALGRRVIVRQNHVRGFQTGVSFTAIAGSATGGRLWMVAETMAESSATAVIATAGVIQANNLR